jgi:5-hydroxyisourate hydrolase
MTLSTHVLDTSAGRPAAGVPVVLYHHDGSGWTRVGHAVTDDDGRVKTLVDPSATVSAGAYRIVFEISEYFGETDAFYSEITIDFVVRDQDGHYHVPLLVSPYGYSTYRGT